MKIPPFTVRLELGKSTAGTHVYHESDATPRDQRTFPTIYVQKHVLPDPPPPVIRVTVDHD